jgi:hypothetical protein
VQPGPAGSLQTALNNANAGDELVLADGTYTGVRVCGIVCSDSEVLGITKSISIRALNAGRAVLDGENARRVIHITAGTVTLHGLDIMRGSPPSTSCITAGTGLRQCTRGGGVRIEGGNVSICHTNIYQNTGDDRWQSRRWRKHQWRYRHLQRHQHLRQQNWYWTRGSRM